MQSEKPEVGATPSCAVWLWRIINVVFVAGAWLVALYAWMVYGVLTEWLIPLGKTVAPSMQAAFQDERAAIYTHALTSAVALAIGPFQVIPSFRKNHMWGHRWAGRLYIASGICGSASGIVCAQRAYGGITARVGFTMLGCLWLASNVGGVIAVAALRRVELHKRLMQLSCALAYSAVSLRVMLGIAARLVAFEDAYRAIAWLCWLVNLVVLFGIWAAMAYSQGTAERISTAAPPAIDASAATPLPAEVSATPESVGNEPAFWARPGN